MFFTLFHTMQIVFQSRGGGSLNGIGTTFSGVIFIDELTLTHVYKVPLMGRGYRLDQWIKGHIR